MKNKFRLFKLLFGFLIIGGALLTAIPFFLSLEEYRGEISAAIQKATGQNVLIRGDISARFLPLPQILVDDIYLSEPSEEDDTEEDISSVINIKQLKGRLSLLALLSGSTELASITLVKPTTSWDNIRNIRDYWGAKTKSESDANTGLIATYIENGRIFLGDARQRGTTRIQKINAEIDAGSASGPFIVRGDFLVNNNSFSFDADISLTDAVGEGGSTWNFVGDGFEVTFIGDLVGKEGGSDNTLSGTLRAGSQDFDYIIAKYFQGKDVAPPSDEDENSQEQPNPILAEGKLTYSQNLIRIEEFSISSDYISGNGWVTISTESVVPEMDLSLMLNNINLDKFIEGPEHQEAAQEDGEKAISAETFIAQAQDSEDFYARLSRLIGSIAKDVNVLSDISIKSLTYREQTVANIVFNADMFNGDFAINEFTAKMPGNSSFEVTGTIKHNEIRPRFSGELAMSGENMQVLTNWLGFSLKDAPQDILGKYKFNADLVLLPQKINFSGIDLMVDETQVNGSAVLRYGDRSPKLITNLNIAHLDLDEYGFSKPISNLIATYYKEDPNNPKTKNFNWLRSLQGQFGGELVLEDFTFNGTRYKEVSSLFSVTPGKFKLEKLDLSSDTVKLTSSLNFDITSIRPKVSVKITATALDTSAFVPKEDGAVEAEPVEQTDPATETPAAPASVWSKDDIYFFDLGRFDGTLEVAASNFKHKNIELQNLDFKSRLYEGTIGFDTFNADFDSGKVIIKGVLMVEENPKLAISFALNNIKAEKLLQTFTDIKAITGYISVNGSIVTFGKSYADWVKNAKSSLAMVGRAVKVEGMDIHGLISKAEDVTTAKMVEDLAAAAAKSGTTEFDTIGTQAQLSKGLLDFTGMKLTTSRVSGAMNGRVDLNNWLMSLVGQFAYITVDSRQRVSLGLNVTGGVDSSERSFNIEDLLKVKGIAVAPSRQNNGR